MTPEETNENLEQNAEPIAEHIENANTDPIVAEEVITETVAEIVAEPVAEIVAEPVTEIVAEPVAEIAAEPVAEIVDEPVAPAPVRPARRAPVAPVAPADFDWDAIGKKHEIYSSEERTKLEDAYDQTLRAIQDHEVIEGTVVTMTNREIIVNIGFKSDGVIQMNEFRYNPELKIGDKVEVYIENQEDTSGQLLLSHKKARILKSWERINDAYEKQEIIKGYVKSRTKGGLIVDIFGIEAFLPGSQIDVKPIRDYDVFVDKVMEFKVVKINHEYKNVVVSHKALIEDELEAQKAEIIKKLEKGQILEGTVKNITSYGVFVDLGGVDGLVHITDLSWGRINHPEEIVKLDQKI
jgi:small subunit ribosomal protein S1